MLGKSRPIVRPIRICLYCRQYATTPPTTLPAPPLLLKLRTDLKTAMKDNDTNRKNVLRNLLAEITNAAKTSSPMKSDMQLLSLLRKRAAASRSAGTEFANAGRSDLKEKEDAQVAVLEEYAGGVQTMSGQEIQNAVTQVVEEMKAQGGKLNMGDVLKKLLAPGGSLDGKPVEKSEVAKVVKEVLA